MAEDTHKILNAYKTEVESGKYKLMVITLEKYWAGNNSGKMEDMPGVFLESTVSLGSILGELSPVDTLALTLEVKVLSESKKEITNEPKGYAKLFHKQLVEKVKKNPDEYIQRIRAAVKKKL